mgnify:CR=1 FL=1
MSTLQELFNKAKGVQETSLWDLCAAAGYTEDRLYKPGEISRRKDGDYQKLPDGSWTKVAPAEKTYKNGSQNFVRMPRSLGAVARKFKVKKDYDLRENGWGKKTGWTIKEGTTIRGAHVMDAGKQIDCLDRLMGEYDKGKGLKRENWEKCEGYAAITDGKTTKIVCVHWYQCKDLGKVEFKEKVREIKWE